MASGFSGRATIGRDLYALFAAGTNVGLTDRQLLARFAEGQADVAESAFAALVERHGGLVLRTCRDILAHPHDAEDAAQAVFLVLARKANSIRKADSLASWLIGTSLRVAKHMRDDALRRKRRETRAAERAASSTPDERPPDRSKSDDYVRLYEELQRLPERYRQPLVLCHLEGLSHEQAAERLGCAPRTINTRLTRGKARLRERLIRLGLVPTAALLQASPARATPSAAWVESTTRAAVEFASGKAVAATSATALAQGVLSAMIAAKMKLATVAGLACLLALGLMPLAFKPEAAPVAPLAIAAMPLMPDDPPAKAEGTPRSKAAEVVVLDAETGKPIPGATVKFSLDTKEVPLATDAKGMVRIDLTGQRPSAEVWADVWAEGYVQQRLGREDHASQKGREVEKYEFRLRKGDETLGGTVKDEEGRPIAGVRVELWGYLADMKDKKELAYMVDTRTDDQGRWRNRSLRKMQWAAIYLSHPDFISDDSDDGRWFGKIDGSEGRKALAPLLDFSDVQVMKRGTTLAGTIRDEAGAGIPRAEVTWIDPKQFHSRLPRSITWTRADDQGRFSIKSVRPGSVAVIARASRHAPELTYVDASGDVKDAELTLKPAKVLTGRAVDPKGRPIEGAVVCVDSWREFRGLGVYFDTDRDGRFRWEDAPTDLVMINVESPGRSGIVFRRTQAGGPEVVLTLRKAIAIGGTVRDLATKKPIPQAECEVGLVDPKTGEVKWEPCPRNELGGPSLFVSQGELHGPLDNEDEGTYQIRIKAPGYEPFVSRSIKGDERDVKLSVVLTAREVPPLKGTVVDANGKPMSGAEVVLAGPNADAVNLSDGKFENLPANKQVKSGKDGQFTIPPSAQPDSPYVSMMVIHDEGYAEIPLATFEETHRVTIKPWSRIEGVYRVGGKPMPDREISYYLDRLFNPDVPQIFGGGKVRTDAQGRFAIDRVTPGDIRVAPAGRANPEFAGWSSGTLVKAESGRVITADVGGKGRPIVAHVATPEGFDPKMDLTAHSVFSVESDQPFIPYPDDLVNTHDGRVIPWGKAWFASEEGFRYRLHDVRRTQIKLGKNGAIRVDDLPAGSYKLTVTISDADTRSRFVTSAHIAKATRQFVIPEMPGGRSDEPLDLGEIQAGSAPALKIGDDAPGFEVKTLDGKMLKLADLKGKVVLVDFWATWCGPCVKEMPALKAVRERFRGDDRVAMIGLSLDAEADAAREFVSKQGIDWLQGHLGDWSDTDVPNRWAVDAIPAMFLISTDGKILATELKGEAAIADAIKQALGQR